MIPSSDISEVTFKDYLDIITKRIGVVIAFVVVVVSFVAFYDFSSVKVYQAKTSIVIEQQNPKITTEVEGVYGINIKDREHYQTQLSILQSNSLAERIIEKLELSRDSNFRSVQDPVAKLISMVSIKPVRDSNMVILYVSGTNPLQITQIANSWAREFINEDVERRIGTASYGVSWLEVQLSDTLKKLQEAEKDLNTFIRDNRIVTLPDIESKKETLIEALKSQESQLNKDIAEASKRYKAEHPKMISLSTRLKEIEEQLSDETTNFISAQEKIYEYKVFKRKVDTYKALYEDLLKRAKELDISKELTISNIRVVDPATEPKVPIRPRPLRDILLALMVSLFLGISSSVFLEHLDSSIKTAEDVELYAKFPFLGFIPSAKKEALNEEDLALVSKLKSFSVVSEAFRNLKVSLLFSFPQDKPLKTLTVTSSVPQEGKSFVSSNLAVIFAQAGDKTLLIDADMRRGRLGKVFKAKKEKGLSGVLTGISSLEKAIMTTSVPNLYFLPSGAMVPNPTELLSSEKFPTILRELESQYKRIIIDSTPVLSVAEAIILGDKCDGLVFVIKGGGTSIKLITEAKRIIGSKVKVIGAILNNIDKEQDRYYYYNYNYTQKEK